MGGGPVARNRHLVGALILLGTAAAGAESPGPAAAPRSLPSWVRLLLPECPTSPVDSLLLLEVLRTELRDDGVQRVDSGRVEPGKGDGPQAYLRLTLPCEGEVLEATLRVEDPGSLKAVERRMEFGDLPSSARPRAIALGLAELLRAAWSWLVILEPPLVSVPEEAPAVAVSEATLPVEPPPSSSEWPAAMPPPDPEKLLAALSPTALEESLPVEPPDRSPSLHLGGKTLWFFDLMNPVWGGQAMGEYGRWSLGAQLLAGSESTNSGGIRLRLVTGSLGFTALSLSSERFDLRGGLSVSAGDASVQGSPLEGVKGARGRALYLGAMLSVRTRWWLSSAWAFVLEAEGGHAAGLVATVDGKKRAALAGWQGGLSVGVSIAP